MAEETKNGASALEKLKELQKRDTISSLEIKEPVLKNFDASSVFEIDEKPQETKHKIFGKRSQRHAQVNIKETTFENDNVEVEDIYVSKPLKRSQKHHAIIEEETKPEEKPVLEPTIEEKEPEKIEPAEVEAPKEAEPEVIVEEVQEIPKETIETTEEIIEVEEEPVQIDNEDQEGEIERSLEDQNDYDEEELYVEKKRFLLSQYDKEEEFLAEQSEDGYHYVRNVGKKYFFVKDEPKEYYYSICYFAVEPSSYEWRQWEADGWKLVSRVPAKKKKDAGWFVFRNEYGQDELKKEIANEAEKFKFFKKYSNSCRSTMFLFFICMAICACAAFLQYMFNGFLIFMIICAVLFLISFIFFCIYGRMLASSNKKVRLLKARLRVRERQESFDQEGEVNLNTTQEELDTEWNSLDNEELDLEEDEEDELLDDQDSEEYEEEYEEEDEEEEKPKRGLFRRKRK